MYVIVIHVPIYVDGDRKLVATDWYRALVLLRDSFQGRYGPIQVLAPHLPVQTQAYQILQEVHETAEDILLTPSFDLRCRARHYWLRERTRWKHTIRHAVSMAQVVHSGLDDLYRPIAYAGFLEAVKQNKPVVFVQDGDIVVRHRDLSRGSSGIDKIKSMIYCYGYEKACKFSVMRASLSLLKGKALIRRYGKFAKNAQLFHDTSYSSAEVTDRETVDQRLATLRTGRPLRFVYCGRLVRVKGLDHSLGIMCEVRAMGGNVTLDIIGDGEEREGLVNMVEKMNMRDCVRFLGSIPYGGGLIRKLAGYDALLFTSCFEETPRMIFDGYAAGLPLFGYDIPYVRERAEDDHSAVLLPRGDIPASAHAILDLVRQPQPLIQLTKNALDAGLYHSADNWYQRRADWTIEAVGKHSSTVIS